MTPKEKAKELVDKYYQLAESIKWSDKDTMSKAEKLNDELGKDVLFYWNELAKKSALIAVDELIDFENRMIDEWARYFEGKGGQMKIERLYWEEVKEEIKKL